MLGQEHDESLTDGSCVVEDEIAISESEMLDLRYLDIQLGLPDTVEKVGI